MVSPTDYEHFAVELAIGDLVVVYSDARIEARDPDGTMLGESRLFDLARHIGSGPARLSGEALASALEVWRGRQPQEDDQTLLVLEHVGGEVPPRTFGVAVRSLLKILKVLMV